MNNMICLFAGWKLKKVACKYYISRLHKIYIDQALLRYKKVYLLLPVRSVSEVDTDLFEHLDTCQLEIIPLPCYRSYLDAMRHFFSFYKKIKVIPSSVLFYCRVPDPYSWMPSIIGRKCILHFVGDSIDATINNKQWSFFKKMIMIIGYFPEYLLTLIACRNSTVYTNGFHLCNKLKKLKISSTSVISSTINKDDLISVTRLPPIVERKKITLVYAGYLRYAKGINTLMELILILKEKSIDFSFNIIGDGELFKQFEQFAIKYELTSDVNLLGHIDSRINLLNQIGSADLFIFPSLSEGSPRVVIEAMSQGIPVISTPVGSLPFCFDDGVDITFVKFEDAMSFFDAISDYIDDPNRFLNMSKRALCKIKEKYTLDSFFDIVYNYET